MSKKYSLYHSNDFTSVDNAYTPMSEYVPKRVNDIENHLYSILPTHVNQYIVIDSIVRNTNAYPNPNHYTYYMDNPIDKVFRIVADQFLIPIGDYNINNNYSTINFTS